MDHVDTLRECFRHHDWARDKVLGLARGLGDGPLDRPFEMGPGSLRATLRHLYGAARFWYARWQGAEPTPFPHARELGGVDEIREAERALATARNALLDGASSMDLRRVIEVERETGTLRFPLGGLMLHVCNHGIHHRAQVLNMLRHLGVHPLPGLDHLFFRAEQPTVAWADAVKAKMRHMGNTVADTPAEPGRVNREALQYFFRYADWAQDQVHAVAAGLSDAQLDQPFEVGLGSLRVTLVHICDAEYWWHHTWLHGPRDTEGQLNRTMSLAALQAQFARTAAERDAYLAAATDDELQRVVVAPVTPDLPLSFRVGESMLELCGHGTHHRAQALNMLRRLGATVPKLDLATWIHPPSETTPPRGPFQPGAHP
jgi:uncharacterized damage-inducible protein DinB